jgi:hypothetical protein
MALEDMPDINSPQFAGWLLQQDQQTQQEIMRYIGMDQASSNAPSTQGAFAPSISPFAYDAPSMLGGIPQSTNSKGVANPYNVESAQKYLNYGQDLTGSAGLGNNMLSWMTGPQATDPTAWQPIKTGKGSPLMFENSTVLDALANSGADDWQTFVAQELTRGTPAQAFAKLKATVRSGKASQGLLDSLDVNPNFDPVSEDPDISNDTGFATMYDVKGMKSWAEDLFKGVANDRALQGTAYQDPKTGQYYSGYEEQKTEQMQAADKLGLAYPTSNYGDQSLVDQYTERSLGVTPGEAAYRDQSRNDRIAGLATARDATAETERQRGTQYDELIKAWNDNFQAPAQSTMGQPAQMPGMGQFGPQGTRPSPQGGGMAYPAGSTWVPGAPKPLSPQTSTKLPWDPATAPALVGGQAGMQAPALAGSTPFTPFQDASQFQPQGRNVLNTGTVTPAAGGAPYQGTTPPSWLDPATVIAAGAAPTTNTTGTKTQSTQPQVYIGADGNPVLATDANRGMGFPIQHSFGGSSDGLDATSAIGKPKATAKRTMNPSDIRTAAAAKETARRGARDANEAYLRSFRLDPTDLERVKLRASMNYLASQGRTPLTDQLAARSQTLRNLIGA